MDEPKPLISLFGIEIRLHISVLIIFALIVASLGRGLLPHWHPEWTQVTCWAAALIAGVLFFCSLLAHELSHALVARSRGLTTRSITLFLFGGMAAIDDEPKKPADELLIAAAGPLMSLAIALGCAMLVVLTDGNAVRTVNEAPANLPSQLSLIGTICLWLASINFMLAAFNLIPGFPMDGGRLFRAALWWRSGDIIWATRQASKLGRIFGWLLIFAGAWSLAQGALMNGLWLVLIGWFIDHLAQASVTQLLLDRALAATTVDAIMRTHFDRVPESTSAAAFISDYVLRSRQKTWPVTGLTQDLGYLTIDDLPKEPQRDYLQHVNVGEYMRKFDERTALAPNTNARQALKTVSQSPDPLPVIDNGTVVGLIDQLDILRWFNSVQANGAQAPLRA